MKLYRNLFLLFTLGIFISCADGKKQPEPEVKTIDTNSTADVALSEEQESLEFKDQQTADVYQQYQQLKNALVATDAEKASTEASNLITALTKKGADETVLKAAQNIVETDDVEKQRTAFVAVTTGVEAMLEGALSSGTIYKQYCPMAFNNTGGSWLSTSKEIRNPYFGDKMLKCGRVEAEIK